MNTLEQQDIPAAQNANAIGLYDAGQTKVGDMESQAQVERPHSRSEDRVIPTLGALSFLDRFLVVWILLAMIIGILLGDLVPSTSAALQRGQFVGVSIPIATGLLTMIYPPLCKVRYETLHLLFTHSSLWKQLLLSLFLNWICCPLLMLALSWSFLPDEPSLRQGLIYVGIARCIAMVLIWTDLAGGDTEYCAVLVAVNSLLQIVLFAPLAVFYVRVVSGERGGDERTISYAVVATSVAVFLGIPLFAAVITRLLLLRLLGLRAYAYFLRAVSPFSLLGLLFTIVVLFASQGRAVITQIVSVVRVSAPLIVYFFITFTFTVWLCRKLGFGYRTSATQSFTAASNNFELAIAVVVAVYGVDSQQALASTVGPLVEVPVLLGCVYGLKWWQKRTGWGEVEDETTSIIS